MRRVLVDTDVILDFFFDRKPFSDEAARVLALCESEDIAGYVTSVIISNVYYLLRQSARHEKVIEKLNQLISIVEVLITNKEIIKIALNSGFKDFKNSTLGVMTPENYLKIKIAEQK